MRKERLTAAHMVAEKLFEAEEALDLAIARAAELNAALPTARQEANLSAVVAQDAFMTASRILPALMQARQELVDTHGKLDDAKDQIGLRHVAIGHPDTKPPMVAGEADLRVVGKAA